MADVSAGVWMPQTKKQRRWKTGLIPFNNDVEMQDATTFLS